MELVWVHHPVIIAAAWACCCHGGNEFASPKPRVQWPRNDAWASMGKGRFMNRVARFVWLHGWQILRPSINNPHIRTNKLISEPSIDPKNAIENVFVCPTGVQLWRSWWRRRKGHFTGQTHAKVWKCVSISFVRVSSKANCVFFSGEKLKANSTLSSQL